MIQRAYEALTEATAMENYRVYGHPDGLERLSPSRVLPDFFQPGGGAEGSSNMAIWFGVAFLCFIGFGVFAWWRNKALDRSQRDGSGPLQLMQEDVQSMGDRLKAEGSMDSALVALVTCPVLRRALRGRRVNWMKDTIKASGAAVAGMMERQKEEEDGESYAFLQAELEKLGCWPHPVLEAFMPSEGNEGAEEGGGSRDTQTQTVSHTGGPGGPGGPTGQSEAVLLKQASLLVLSQFYSESLDKQQWDEKLSQNMNAERKDVIRLSAKLLDIMLVQICLPQRWLQATQSTLALTARFSSGTDAASEAKTMELMKAALLNEKTPAPELELAVTLTHEGQEGQEGGQASDGADGGDGGEGQGISIGDPLELKVSLRRRHNKVYKRMVSAVEAAREAGLEAGEAEAMVVAALGASPPGEEEEEAADDDEEEYDSTPPRPDQPIREAYWLVAGMSNGQETRFGAVAPLIVKNLVQPCVRFPLSLKAPSTPGDYTISFHALSPTVVGHNATFVLPFRVKDIELKDEGEEAEEAEGGSGDGEEHSEPEPKKDK